MPTADDQDTAFRGIQDSSTPFHLLQTGDVSRIINSRFVEGAISNAVGFDELDIHYVEGDETRVFASRVTYGEILRGGDVQLVAPLENIAGKFLIMVISGILFSVDLDTLIATDITPIDSFLPTDSSVQQLSYLDNDGGTYGVGGYLVIFNYPNLPIFVNHEEARLSDPTAPDYEMPVARVGATAGNRAFVVSGENIMFASDPLGGASSLAPLTFKEFLEPGSTFRGDTFSIGSSLDLEYVTAACRLPKFLGPNQDFLAQNLLFSTDRHKYIVAAGAARDTWDSIQFITFAGTSDGIAGPEACTNVGDNILYIADTGRIKTIAQDQEKETALVETYIDDPLGQYLCPCEISFYYRDWYKKLDHSHSIIKYNRDRIYATVYPFKSPAIGKFGERLMTTSHRALAVASLSSETLLGPQAKFAWEGFYDWLKPVGMVVLGDDLYTVSKDEYGRIKYYMVNFTKIDTNKSTIYTRGYLNRPEARSRSLLKGSFFFRRYPKNANVQVSYLANDKWICGAECTVTDNLLRFNISKNKCKTDSYGIPLKIDIDHKGCRFELESVRIDGELHRDER